MDNLKEYLLLYKNELDVDSPASNSWESIASRLDDDSRGQYPGPASKADFRPGPNVPASKADFRPGPNVPASTTDFRPGPEVPAKSRYLRRLVRYVAAACLLGLVGVGSWLAIREKKAPADSVKTDREAVTQKTGAPGATGRVKPKSDSIRSQQSRAAGAIVARNPAEPVRAPHKAGPHKEAKVPDEIVAIDKSYSTLIDFQLKKVRAMPLYAENSAYFSFYVEQFKEMDRDEAAVRSDIRTYGLTGEFLEQLINVYQQKLNVLKNLQTEINKMNNKVKEKQSPSAISQVHYLNI